jgi:hypothetical protein
MAMCEEGKNVQQRMKKPGTGEEGLIKRVSRTGRVEKAAPTADAKCTFGYYKLKADEETLLQRTKYNSKKAVVQRGQYSTWHSKMVHE